MCARAAHCNKFFFLIIQLTIPLQTLIIIRSSIHGQSVTLNGDAVTETFVSSSTSQSDDLVMFLRLSSNTTEMRMAISQ